MRRSTDRILTTHVGALPAPLDVWARPEVADDRLREAVAEVVTAQRDAGVDFINEGELTKGGHWVEYLPTRLGGYAPAEGGAYTELLMSSKDWVDFQDFYLAVLQNGTLFEQSGATQHVPEGAEETTPTDDWIAAEPIHYRGHELLEREIAVMRDSIGDIDPSDAFLTTTAPLSVEPGRVKGIYASDEEHVDAIAEAMRVEYEAIAAAGFQVQVDDAWLGALWDRIGIPMGTGERLAQLENFDGLWFGNMSAEAPTLTEYLGDFAWYLKIYTARDPQGTEVIGEPQRWRVPGNWKIACENVMGDSYHVQTTHRSVFECGIHPNQAKDFTSGGARNGIHIDAGYGTTGLSRQSAVERGYPRAMQDMFAETLSPEHRDLLFGEQPLWPTRAHLFPNFSLLCAGARISSTELHPYILMRTWRPIDADTLEIWSWVLVEKGASDEFKEKSARAYVLTFGPAGTEEVDDAENWSSMQRAFHGAESSAIGQVLTMGGKDEMDELVIADWPAPGTAIASSYTDAGNRRFHALWRDLMEAE